MNRRNRDSIILGIALLGLIVVLGAADATRKSLSGTEIPAAQLSPQHKETALTILNCWIGICPSSTTLAQAQTLLEAHYGKDKVTPKQDRITWQTGGQEDEHQSGWLSANSEGVVDEVYISFKEGQMTVAQLIGQLGEPSFVYVSIYPSKCAGSMISFSYIGIYAWLRPASGSIGIQPLQSVASVMLLPLEKARKWSITDHAILKWQGFTDYCTLLNKAS